MAKVKLGNTLALVALMEKVARADDGTDDGQPGRIYGEGIINLARDMGIREDDIVDAICGKQGGAT